ncbi:UDP-N-acetyl-D-glucosamine dehydrogenase [Streptomyces sp. CB01201]|uniref:nucleotide sugar dehydrogenase n=1 Tax=Streptomyces sp. CB01201 TaxID=2020324 RepID=UPI000C27E255|nr:nucleotide sugar dehydrogenase [Streptomyces sp. CB01201]PJM98526.1 UDP-N-acetyl-D-glucosamine dehydrogenase [Streptomyces sp. CB01201]
MTYDVAVIGLGYVGLALAVECVRSGLRVAGLESDPHRAAALVAGESYVDDVPDAELVAALKAGLSVGTDASVLADSEVVVLCVPTPLDADRRPDVSSVREAAATVARHLRADCLVVVESTIWPGATDQVVRPLLEHSGLRAGEDFALAYSPERVDPGNPHFYLRNTPKVVAGYTTRCRDRAEVFYGKLVDEVVPVSGLREAEMAKLLENTYRAVNIALVNEMAVLCDAMDVDLWESITAAATKPFGFERFLPGPGVGGHCIPVDPEYLSHAAAEAGSRSRFVDLAREVNASMSSYVVERVRRNLDRRGMSLRGARLVLLGVTYKADVADLRESPAMPIERGLRLLGATVSFVDPLVDAWRVDGRAIPRQRDTSAALASCDMAVLLQAHAAFDLESISRQGCPVLDTRGALPASDFVELL